MKYYVMYGSYGLCWDEYETLEEAEKIAEWLESEGEEVWICSDEDEDFEPDYDECGFNPYMGCYDFDC